MRDCGECTVCCTLTYIPELSKLEGHECSHCSNGCSIYSSRPEACKKYECEWYKGNLPEELRPDKCGVMIEVYPKLIAALLTKNVSLQTIDKPMMDVLKEYVQQGHLVVSMGQSAMIPEGMPFETAKRLFRETIMEYRYGGKL